MKPNQGPAVDVVVPTHQGRDLTAACLEHLGRQSLAHRTIVVDNASTDGTKELIAARHPDVELIARPGNDGFTIAVNAGIRQGTAPFVVVLNNDVTVGPRFLQEIVAPLRDEPEVGMVAALLLQRGGRVVDSVGLEADRTLAAFPRLWGEPAAAGPAADSRGLLGPTGGAAAYRRRALEEVGLFDEAIFIYLEDADLAFRLQAAGWRCAGAPEAVGIHLGSATMGPHSPRQVYLRSWSRGYLLRKYGVLTRLGNAVRVLLGDGSSVVWGLVAARDPSALLGRIRGWRAARPSALELAATSINRELTVRDGIRRRRRYRG